MTILRVVPLLLMRHLARGRTPSAAPVMTIGRLHYDGGGDWYANPSSLPNLLAAIRTRTGIRVSRRGEGRDPIGRRAVERSLHLHDGPRERALERRGRRDAAPISAAGRIPPRRRQLRHRRVHPPRAQRLFPDHPLVEVPLDHPIYHLVYDFPKGIPKIHVHDGKPAQGFGIFLDGRLAVYYSYQSDLGDGWEDFEVHHDPPGEARGGAAHGREPVRLRGRVRRVTAPATHLPCSAARPLRPGPRRAGPRSALGAGALLLGAGLGGPAGLVRRALLGAGGLGARRRRAGDRCWLAWRAQRRDVDGRHCRTAGRAGRLARGRADGAARSPAAGTSGALLELADRTQADAVARRGRAPPSRARPVGARTRARRARRWGSPRSARPARCTGPPPRSGIRGARGRRPWPRCASGLRRDRRSRRLHHLRARGVRPPARDALAPGAGRRLAAARRLPRLAWATRAVTTGALQSDLYRPTHQRGRARTPCSCESACRFFWAPVGHGALSGLSRSGRRAGPRWRRYPRSCRPARDWRRAERRPRRCGPPRWTLAGESHSLRVSVDVRRQLRSRRVRGATARPCHPGWGAARRRTPCACPFGSWRTARRRSSPGTRRRHLAPISLLVPLVLDVRDDHGLTSVTLESRRISRLGVVDSGPARERDRCRRSDPTARS